MAKYGMAVEIYWVPCHIGVGGNEKEDKAAKEAAEKTNVGRCLERFVSLGHVGCTISEWK